MKLNLSLCMILICTTFLFGSKPQNISSDLASLHKSINILDNAFLKRDMNQVSEMYSDDGYLLQDDGQIIKGKAAIRQFWKRGLPNAELSFQNVELKKKEIQLTEYSITFTNFRAKAKRLLS